MERKDHQAQTEQYIVQLWYHINEEKPEERGPEARAYAVTLTKLEDVLSYYHTYIVEGRTLQVPEEKKHGSQ